VSFAQEPLGSADPMHVTHKLSTTPGLALGEGYPTRRPEGDQHPFFGKITLRWGPYSSGTATATFLSSSGCRQQCQSFTGNLHHVEQKWFRTP